MTLMFDPNRDSLTLEEKKFESKYKDKGIAIVPPIEAFRGGEYDYNKRKDLLQTLPVEHLLIVAAGNKAGMCVLAEEFIFIPPQTKEELNKEISEALKAVIEKAFN